MSAPSRLVAALAALQNGFVVVKTNANPSLNSKYADYADIRAALDPKLKEHGLAISFRPGKMRSDGTQWVQEMALAVCHVESGERDIVPAEFPLPEGNRGVNFAQRYGSALTYSMRYLLVAFFGIITGDDDDANRARRNETPPDRDAPPQASDHTHWSLLMDGHWMEAASPNEGWGTVREMTLKERAEAWKKNPTHAALTAWAADRLTTSLSELGADWGQFCEKAGGSWPARLEDCTPEQIKSAGMAAKALLGKTV